MSRVLEVALKESTSHPTAENRVRLTTGGPQCITFRPKKEKTLLRWSGLEKETAVHMSPLPGGWVLKMQPINWRDTGSYKGHWNQSRAFFGTTETLPDSDRFMQERGAFLHMKSRLVSSVRYAGKFVAVYNGKVVGYDENIVGLARRMYERYGYSPIYIGKAEREEQVLELPSPEV